MAGARQGHRLLQRRRLRDDCARIKFDDLPGDFLPIKGVLVSDQNPHCHCLFLLRRHRSNAVADRGFDGPCLLYFGLGIPYESMGSGLREPYKTPVLAAIIAASVRLRTPIFRKMALRCSLMVTSASSNSRAISLFDRPRAVARRTSVSRGVSAVSQAGAPSGMRALESSTSGGTLVPPASSR